MGAHLYDLILPQSTLQRNERRVDFLGYSQESALHTYFRTEDLRISRAFLHCPKECLQGFFLRRPADDLCNPRESELRLQ